MLLMLPTALFADGSSQKNEIPGSAEQQGPAGLRCEYLSEPLGLDETAPRLSWINHSPQRGWTQSAYQVLVSSNTENLANGVGDLWDSGRVDSDESSEIVYRGKKPGSRQPCFWKVRVWSNLETTPRESMGSVWEMGLLEAQEWKARWIGRKAGQPALPEEEIGFLRSEIPVETRCDPAPYLRRPFQIDGNVVRARIYASALGFGEIRLNGRKVGGDRERDPGFTDYSKRVPYVTYDVTSLIKDGTNVIGSILGTGWYDVHELAAWKFNEAPWRDRPKLRLMLVVDYDDGSSETVSTDESWKCAAGPILYDGIYSGEVYDARREMPGWDSTGFDDSKWASVIPVEAPLGKVVAHRCEPVAIMKTIRPKSVYETSPGVWIVDLGQNISGHAQLDLQAPAGTVIRLRYAEWLKGNGQIDRANIMSHMQKTQPPQPFQTDIYICKGGDRETWEQRFSYSGFQYVEVSGFPGKLTADNIRGRFAHTAFEKAGEFACSDKGLNQLQHMVEMSYLANSQNYPTDCPQREKNGWTADAHLTVDLGLLNYHSQAFYEKWLQDFGDAQASNGSIPVIIPSGGWGRHERPDPEWDAAWAIIAWELYQYGGNLRVLEENHDGLRRYVDCLASLAKGNKGLVKGSMYGDWSPYDTQTPKDFTANAYYFRCATILAETSRLLGKTEDAATDAALVDKLKTDFNRKFYDATNHTYSNGSQCALSTALLFKIVPVEDREEVFKNLVDSVEKIGHLDTGILGTKNLVRALTEGGRPDLAYRVVSYPEEPGWLVWIERGANTLWNGWKTKGGGSLNHVMWGDISAWFYQCLAGINSDAPGFSRIRIQPQPMGNLSWVKAHHDSPRGRIVSEWSRTGNQFKLKVVVPTNTTATVFVPSSGRPSVTEGAMPASEADGVTRLRHEAGAEVFTVASGVYEFTSTLN